MGKKKERGIKDSQNPNAKDILESAKDLDSPSSPKRPKPTASRRDAIDQPIDFDKSNDNDTSGSSGTSGASGTSASSENEADVPIVMCRSVGVQANIISVDASEFASFRQEMKSDSKKLRSCIQYDIRKLESTVLMCLSSSNKSSSLSLLMEKLNLQRPITDLKSFYEFDNKVKVEKEFADNLRELISFKARAKTLTEAISGVLNTVMSHDLQLKFSACGKPNKGVAKEKLNATQLYSYLKDCLLQQFTTESDSTILSKTSRWLASAIDRQGGRNDRH